MPPDGPRAFGQTVRLSGDELRAVGERLPDRSVLDRPLSSLRGVGAHFEGLAREAGVETVRDLLWLVPDDYEEPAPPGSVADALGGRRCRLLAEVESIRSQPGRGGRRGRTEAMLRDDSGSIKAIWFNRPWVADQLGTGKSVLVVGRADGADFIVEGHEVRSASTGGAREDGPPGLDGDVPRPRHRNFEGIGRGRWRSWAWEACRVAIAEPDPLPGGTRGFRRLPDIAAALRAAHFPASRDEAAAARERLVFEELFLYQLFVRERGRREREALGAAPVLNQGEPDHRSWLAGLPWQLTDQQAAAIEAIGGDLSSEVPMRRLLMGEVGAGKTVVALSAVIRTLGSGRQAALMAPTEVLARQHYLKVGQLLEGTGYEAHLLTGTVRGDERKVLLDELASGRPSLVIGTHALIGDQVEFGSLGLVVIDEEHRFGVRQRAALGGEVGRTPATHRLHLSATPIPRTLALTVWGDLDLTELRELPHGRGSVETVLLPAAEKDRALAELRSEVGRGRQGFVVCPVIRDDGPEGRPSVEAEASRLGTGPLAGCRIGLLHGELPEAEKEEVMAAFVAGTIDVLVSTTVIEVGIDVPNATVMLIEGAESFGLAQLHQLRGRIGRGQGASTCFLLDSEDGGPPNERLAALAGSGDGFEIAEADLRLRGEGELAGTRQHGLPRFSVARLPLDQAILEQARRELDRLDLAGNGLDSPLLAPALSEARDRFGRVSEP